MRNTKYSFIYQLISVLIGVSSCSHIPTKPIVEYDSDNAIIRIIQTDTAAYDSASVSIGSVYHVVFPIKDTITLSIKGILKKLDQIEVAYNLVLQDYQFNIKVGVTHSSDTVFHYRYKSFEINPIKTVDVISGQCAGFYDVNYSRDYLGMIRKWMFKNGITPDSLIIDKTNVLLRQFNYSEKNEYGVLSGTVPVVNSLSGITYTFKSQLGGEYYYLYAFPSKSGIPIKNFVEEKITEGLVDAHKSVNEVFECSNSGGSGPNVLFLIGIDKKWNYEVQPVGVVVIDNIAPKITTRRHFSDRFSIRHNYNRERYENNKTTHWPGHVTLKSQNILINIPNVAAGITSSVSISYGDFEGNSLGGYNIPFYISVYGDVQTITIGSHELNGSSINNGECIRLHIKSLQIGDNTLPLSATDSKGNKSTSPLSIPIVSSSYQDDNDYDDLENRISDLESKIEELE